MWESDEEGEQAWERLPLWARKQIIDKKIHVFTLPGFQIARKATDRADLQLRMQGNAFLGAFFRVSPLLADFRITPEQFREVVHHQYVKKFGRFGEAVVNSNMEVMTQGFERVREIRVGEMEAPDHSTLRGEALLPVMSGGDGGDCHTGCRSVPIPATQHERTPVTQVATFNAAVPCGSRLQPAVHGLCLGRSHGRRHGRHRVQVCRAPRDAPLHRRELHAVHGMHRRLSRHRAAQLFAGSGNHPAHRGRALRDGSRRAPEDVAFPARDREAYPPD